MELQQMRYVLAVAETRNFTRAAEQCFVVQSALSHQIKALEAELGVPLFARTSRRVELTAAGRAFLPAARASLESAERAAVDAAAALGHVRGRLTIGVIPTVTAIDVPTALRRFHEAHPEVRIALQVGSSDELTAGIKAGDIDVAVLGLPASDQPRGVRSRVLARDLLVAVVNRAHPLAEQDSVDLHDLAQETFADFPAGTPGRAQSDLAFTAAGLQRDVAFEATATDYIIDLICQNLAVALLPSAVAPAHPALAALPIVDGPSRTQYLAWSDFNPSPAATAFLDTLRT